ncbi:MAG: hypothetical protein ABIB97_02670 [Patescibacteria group bacterium]
MKRERNQKAISPKAIGLLKTASLSVFVAVFLFIALGFVSEVFSSDWTQPDLEDVAPKTSVSEPPINLGPNQQEKKGGLIIGGLHTEYWIDISSGNLSVNTGNVYIDNDLRILNAPNTLFLADSGLDSVLINSEGLDDDNELQIEGRVHFVNNSPASGQATVTAITGSDQPAFIGRALQESFGIRAKNADGAGISVKGVAGNAAGGQTTFGVMGLAGDRLNGTGDPYSGYLRGMVNFGAALGNPPFYTNSDVLVTNLNVDWLGSSDSSDFMTGSSVASQYIEIQDLTEPQLQEGAFKVAGQQRFDSGLEVSSDNIAVPALYLAQQGDDSRALYIEGGSTSQVGETYYGLYSLAGAGAGTSYAAYFTGTIPITEMADSPLVINSRSVAENLDADLLEDQQASQFLQLDDVAAGITHLDEAFVRLQGSAPGFSQTGYLNLDGYSEIGSGLVSAKITVINSTATGSGLRLEGGSLNDNMALYAASGLANSWAGYFEGDVKVDGHDLYIEDYLELDASGEAAGSGTITDGELNTDITSSFYNMSNSYIFLTITDYGNNNPFTLKVTKNAGSFRVSLYPTMMSDGNVTFNYFIVNKE